MSRQIGLTLGAFAGYLLPYERKMALQHLKIAYPDRTQRELNQIRHQMFCHFGESAIEMIHIKKTLKHVSIDGIEQLKTVAAESGAIVVGGHTGNWEALGAAMATAGVPLTVIARRIYDDRLDVWMRNWRAQFGIETVVRDAPDAAKVMLRALRNKRVLVMLIDQDTDVPSVWVPFFDRPAKTPNAPARLATRGTPLFMASIYRTQAWHHKGSLVQLTDLPDDIEGVTCRLSLELEERIREHPVQWVWIHRRWQSQEIG